MPEMSVRSQTERDRDIRWEHVSGKALKDWVTHVMQTHQMTRAEARQHVLLIMQEVW